MSIPTVFKYLGFPSSNQQRRKQQAVADYTPITPEQKIQMLIIKNREALENQMRVLENHAVDITEDSICSDMLPHANPPLGLTSFISHDDKMKTPNKSTVQDYYVNCPRLF